MPALSTAERHRLAEDHLRIPTKVAKTFPRLLRAAPDDIVADGYVGLVQAANAFDPKQGSTFNTFAWHRVRGSILDSARRLSALSRHEYDRRRSTAEIFGRPSPPVLFTSLEKAESALEREACHRFSSIEDLIDRRAVAARALAEVAKLPKRERALLESFYVAGRTMQETATVLGHCESFTSRLHCSVLRKLRLALRVDANVAPLDES